MFVDRVGPEVAFLPNECDFRLPGWQRGGKIDGQDNQRFDHLVTV